LFQNEDAELIKLALTIPISIALVSKLAVSKFRLVIEIVFADAVEIKDPLIVAKSNCSCF